MTGELDLVRHEGLRQVLTFGPNFRDRGKGVALDAVAEGLDEFIDSFPTAGESAFPRVAAANWRAEILSRCENRLRLTRAQRDKSETQKPLLGTDAMRVLRWLQRYLVLIPVDKAANNVALICKSLYCDALRAELNSDSGAYATEDRADEEVVASHKRYLGPKHLYKATKGCDSLPYLYWLPKFHKQPVGKRFIAASSNCSTALLSKVLSDVLTHILHTLRDKDDDHIAKTGVRRYFVVDSFEEVTDFLSRWRRGMWLGSTCGLYSGDFSTMYTAIQHPALCRAIERTTLEAFEWAAAGLKVQKENIGISWNGGVCSWVRGTRDRHSDSAHTFTHASLNALVHFLVENIFLSNGGALWKQAIGIPMGTNCAPSLANLFLYSYESQYVSSIEQSEGVDKARAFHLAFRYIDDVLSADNPFWEVAVSMPSEKGGLYPAALQLNQTSNSPAAVDFLGIRIETRGLRFALSVFDKRTTFPFRVRRYPLMQSLIPQSIPYGVMVGLLHRIYRICSRETDFVKEAVEVARRLRENGCATHKLKVLFKAFVTQQVNKYPFAKKDGLVNRFCQMLGSS